MAQRTKSELVQDVDTYIKDNGGNDPNKTKGSGHKILEKNIIDSLLAYEEEVTDVGMQNKDTNVAKNFLSPRRFWNGILYFLTLAWTFTEKQIFNKGITLGDNSTPSVNGDTWFDGTNIFVRIGGVVYRVPSSRDARFGRSLFVSKNGNDTTPAPVVGSKLFMWGTAQAAINFITSGDSVIIYPGTYVEIINNFTESNRDLTIVGIGDVRITGVGYLARSKVYNINFTNTTGARVTYSSEFYNCAGYIPTTNTTKVKNSVIGVAGTDLILAGDVENSEILSRLSNTDAAPILLKLKNCVMKAGFRLVASTYNVFVKDTEISCTTFFTTLGVGTRTFTFVNCMIKVTEDFLPSLLGTLSLVFINCQIQFTSMTVNIGTFTKMYNCIHNLTSLTCVVDDAIKDASFTVPI